MIEIRGISHKQFFCNVRDSLTSTEKQTINDELDLLKFWIAKIPERRGTLMEIVTVSLRQQLSYKDIMQLIGICEVDPLVDFFALECYD